MSTPLLYENKLIHSVYSLSSRLLHVPIYQRQYKWDKLEVETLLKDIYAKFNINDQEDFWLGTILLSGDKSETLSLVDGQQRILTMFWIFKHFVPNFQIKGLKSKITEIGIYEKSKDWLFDEIKHYLENDHVSEKKKFKTIENTIINWKKENKRIDDFANYLKDKVKCSILKVEDDYEHFENINSKAVKLNLTEKCLAFLMSGKRYKLIKEKREDFTWLMSDKPHKVETKFNSKFFLVNFIDIFSSNASISSKDKFTNFKEFLSSNLEDNFDLFTRFLQETKNLAENNEKKFEITYLNKVCFAEYWSIYVNSKIKKYDQFLEFFSKTIWKVDLIRHLQEWARAPIRNLVISFVKQQRNLPNFTYYVHTLMKLIDKNKLDYKISFDDSPTKIRRKADNIKRLKVLFYVLYCKNRETPTQFYEFMEHFSKTDIDHIQPQKDALSINFRKEQLDSILNLQLLNNLVNEKCSNKPIDEKLNIIKTDGNGMNYMKSLGDEVIQNWQATQEWEFDAETRIKAFWKLREKSLNGRFVTNQKHLSLDLNEYKITNKTEITSWFQAELDLRQDSNFKEIFTSTEGKCILFKILNSAGRNIKNYRMPVSKEVIHYLLETEDVEWEIWTFHPVLEEFYKCKYSIQDVKEKFSISKTTRGEIYLTYSSFNSDKTTLKISKLWKSRNQFLNY